MEKTMYVGINEEKEKMLKSIRKQILNNKELPYCLKLSLTDPNDNTKILSSPVIFTIRNEIWRDRVRIAIKEHFYDARNDCILRSSNQTGPDGVFVLFYDDKDELTDMIFVYQVSLEEYTSIDSASEMPLDGEAINLSTKKIINEFGIKDVFILVMLEPKLGSNSPYIISSKDEKFTSPDIIKIKPVLSFKVEEQRIIETVYARKKIRLFID